MARIPGLRRLFRFPRRSTHQIDREIDDELSFHLDMVTSELEETGVSDPRDAARRQFGDVDRARRSLRRIARPRFSSTQPISLIYVSRKSALE